MVDTERMMEQKPARILVIDDYFAALQSTSRILAKRGYQVDGASNGKIALRKIKGAQKQEVQYDLLVTDLMMPEMSGLQLMDVLSRCGLHIPALIITAYRDKRMNVELRRRGCGNVLEKPFSSGQLVGAVESLIGRSMG